MSIIKLSHMRHDAIRAYVDVPLMVSNRFVGRGLRLFSNGNAMLGKYMDSGFLKVAGRGT